MGWGGGCCNSRKESPGQAAEASLLVDFNPLWGGKRRQQWASIQPIGASYSRPQAPKARRELPVPTAGPKPHSSPGPASF